jgi:NAD(P)-dependent dehydrogenase (short-subunit alcohol dehydrogenase family)
MPHVLITGASRGIGLEFTRQYAAGGWQVTATCRDPSTATPLLNLHGDIATYPLDVTDAQQLADLVAELDGRPIDLLINNAGVIGDRGEAVGKLDYDAWAKVLWINALAPIRIAEALADNVAASDRKAMLFLTSQLGSIANNSGGQYSYRSSKACLNAAVKTLSVELAGRGITCLLVHPGWVRTDMGGSGAVVSPGDSVAGMRALIDKLRPADNGRFVTYRGEELPW